MCLNQILFDEQIALIGCNAASDISGNTAGDPVRMLRHRRSMADASRLVAAYPYPHRPYDPWADRRHSAFANPTGNR